ncbi:MAG: CinA family protein [Mycoplasmataceae bacterium]|jgi:hypothetical protein|nr:CinA family protein [Mycoplasmataceae bacterium]
MQNHNYFIGEVLKKNNLKICCCECCTSGLISSLLAKIPDSDKIFVGGIIINMKQMFDMKNYDTFLKNTMSTFSSDIIISSFYEQNNLTITVLFEQKKYESVTELSSNDNNPESITIKCMVFLYDLLVKLNK